MSLPAQKSAYWLPEDDWRKVQRCLPILCVEVLPVRRAGGAVREIGLIRRNTPHQGIRWCLIGGRLQYDELIAEAVGREIREALGEGVGYVWDGRDEPLKVAQYMPTTQKGEYFDPRQHAVSLVFAVDLSGAPSPRGEALDFQWFSLDRIPEAESVGFGHGKLLADCLRALAAIP